MSYKLRGTDSTTFVACTIEEFDGWMNLSWASGKSLKKVILPKILTYHCDKNLPPGDFPFTNSGQFLVSNRVAGLFKKMNAQNIDYYESRLIQPNKNFIKGYVTVVIKNIIKCVDLKKSTYATSKVLDNFYYFSDLVLDSNKIPQGTVLFRIKEDIGNKIANEKLKQALEKMNVDGVDFEKMKMS